MTQGNDDRDNGAPVIINMGDVEPQEVKWLWPNRIPLGCLTVLNGYAGEGKSFVTIDLAARITRGLEWPDGTPSVKGSVLFLEGEDDLGYTVRPRLDASGADPTRVGIITAQLKRVASGELVEEQLSLVDTLPLERALNSNSEYRLVVVDPLGSYIGGDTDTAQDNAVRAILVPLAKLADKTGVAILLVTHSRKAAVSRADDLVMGSRAFTSATRSVIHLMHDPADKKRKLLLPGKLNLAPKPDGLAFTIGGSPPRIEWSDDAVDMDTDWLAAQAGHAPKGSNALDEAKAFLLGALEAGPMPQSELVTQATTEGISDRTLKRAKRELRIVSDKKGEGGSWRWKLADEGDGHSKGGHSGPT